MNNLTINGIKLCKSCNQEKALSEFRARKKGDKQSYGNCKICDRLYDYYRRRAKGLKQVVLRKQRASIINTTPIVRFKRISHYVNQLSPRAHKQCRECSLMFLGYDNSVYCSRKCYNKQDRRISRRKERARMRIARVDNVNPILVFEKHQWHCANCNVYTPPHSKGKHHNNSPELDHIIPLSKGGEHSYKNTQLLCRLCNHIKSDQYAA